MGYIPLPIPTTLEEWLWVAIGFQFGLAWSIGDHELKGRYGPKLTWLQAKLLAFSLDLTHHWWIGGLLGNYAPFPLNWFGWGLFYHDWKDVPRRVKRFLGKFWSG